MSSRKCPDCLSPIKVCRELGACGRPAREQIEANGVRGFDSKPWRKTFANAKALTTWAAKTGAVIHGTRSAAYVASLDAHDTSVSATNREIAAERRREHQAAAGNRDAELAAIAKKHLHLSSLAERGRDHLDFHDCHVVGIKRALEAAYEAGRKAGGK